MDKKKIQQLIAKAKRTYRSESEKYNTILTYQGNQIRGNPFENQQQNTQNPIQETEMLHSEPQVPMQQSQVPIQPPQRLLVWSTDYRTGARAWMLAHESLPRNYGAKGPAGYTPSALPIMYS